MAASSRARRSRRRFGVLIGLIALLGVSLPVIGSPPASAAITDPGVNLIENGSFEATGISPGDWDFFDPSAVPGWESSQAVEIWGTGHDGIPATDGNAFIELDANPLSHDRMYQDIETVAGALYVLTFDMRSRGTRHISDDEAVVVEWNGVKTRVQGYHAHAPQVWSSITVMLTGTGGTDRLLIRESVGPGADDSSGPFLDNVSLSPVGDRFTSATMLHDADGVFASGDRTWYFEGLNRDGTFTYGPAPLEDDPKSSYDLTESDIEFLLEQAQDGVVAAGDLADVSDPSGLRTLDGFGNNVRNPSWGSADQNYARIVDARYEDGEGQVRTGPNPRTISNTIFNQNRDGNPNLFGPNAGDADRDLKNSFRGNEFVSAFGQYFDHGLGFLPKGGTNGDGTAAGVMTDIGTEGFPLTLTRGAVTEGTGVNGVAREHVNQTSPFIDQNQAYGSNDAILEFLLERDADGYYTGRLLSGTDADLPTLADAKANWARGVAAGLVPVIDWSDPTTIGNFRGSGDALLLDINPFVPLDDHIVAGDGRVNENAGLSVVHTIWHSNHNFWVDKIFAYFAANGGVPAGVTNEHVFHMAKIINEAEYQRAAFDEFVELLVGTDVHSFMDYNPRLNADLTHEFAAAAYRLGHSMLNNYITVRVPGTKKDTVEVPLFDLFLNPTEFERLGADNLMAGMITSLHQEIDTKVVTTLRNNLLGRPSDLASFNIARGRDLGLPRLNEMRLMTGLQPYGSWSDFESNLRDSSDLARFRQVYSSVDEIDLWVGGLAEKASSPSGFGTDLAINSVMGETFAQVFSLQMIALQDGDRFYYKHRLFETELLLNLQEQDFSQIVERTLGLEYLQADIFKKVDKNWNFTWTDQRKVIARGTEGHDVLVGRNIGERIVGRSGDDTLYGRAGDDELLGQDGDDANFGGAGDDYIVGGSGDDRADGGSGNDTIIDDHGDDDVSGNEGNDDLRTGAGNDELFGGLGNDKVRGGDGNDQAWGGLGNDLVLGEAGDDHVSGGEGSDVLRGGSGNDEIIGGPGDDTLAGGSGADEFWFLPNSGYDLIRDFNPSSDRVDLHRYAWEYGADVITTAYVRSNTEDTPAGAVLSLPSGPDGPVRIRFEGVSRSWLLANAKHTFILADRVEERSNLIVDDKGILIDAGEGTMSRGVNVALGRPATQSSQSHRFGPDVAVDGNTEGNWWLGSVIHTHAQAQPWWQVDLGDVTEISAVTLYNRTDCCSSRLQDVWIFISDEDLTGRSYADIVTDDSVQKLFHPGAVGHMVELPSTTASGRFVRVQLSSPFAYLHVAEVEVYFDPLR